LAHIVGIPFNRMPTMRGLATLLGLVYVLLSTVAAADSRTFVIANWPDGYGIDKCLASGARCGQTIANSYCSAHGYAQAASFRTAEAAEVTGAVPTVVESSWRARPQAFVAIECTR
jgi:hypothetical protein